MELIDENGEIVSETGTDEFVDGSGQITTQTYVSGTNVTVNVSGVEG